MAVVVEILWNKLPEQERVALCLSHLIKAYCYDGPPPSLETRGYPWAFYDREKAGWRVSCFHGAASIFDPLHSLDDAWALLHAVQPEGVTIEYRPDIVVCHIPGKLPYGVHSHPAEAICLMLLRSSGLKIFIG